jgi:hypothetical protein
MTDPAELEREDYPGELRELRAVLRSVAQHGCLECQLRASIAARLRQQWPPSKSLPSPTMLRLSRPPLRVVKERK